MMRSVHLHQFSKTPPPLSPRLVSLFSLLLCFPQPFPNQQPPYRLVIHFDRVTCQELLCKQHWPKSLVSLTIKLHDPCSHRFRHRPVPASPSQPMHQPHSPFFHIPPKPSPALPITYPQHPRRLRHLHLPSFYSL